MYLLDTDIVIFFFKGKFDLHNTLSEVGTQNCFISEITFAELLYGAKKSAKPAERIEEVMLFVKEVSITPISGALEIYATERVRLEAAGKPLDDFDLLIGCTAISNDLILVTNNTKHFSRLNDIKLQNWTNMSSDFWTSEVDEGSAE